MNRTFKASAVALILAAGFADLVAAGPVEDQSAWERRHAEQGEDLSQYSLGRAYDEGEQVPQDFAEAMKWYRLAADKGFSLAQRALGGMYYLGRGVPQDFIRAHMWFNLAAAQGDSTAVMFRDYVVAPRMIPAQIAEAQQLAREWKPTSPPVPPILK
jgi:TPR repeat protein